MTDQTKLIEALDGCEMCLGHKGGVPGNENRVLGVVMCDYCHSAIMPALDSLQSPVAAVSDGVRETLDRSPAQFFFEVGFGAAYAEALVKNDMKPPFEFSDALVEHAWSIAGEAHDDHQEFDRYLAAANATPAPDQGEVERLIEELRAFNDQPDDRVRPLLLASANLRDAADWNYGDAERVIAFLLSRAALRPDTDRGDG